MNLNARNSHGGTAAPLTFPHSNPTTPLNCTSHLFSKGKSRMAKQDPFYVLKMEIEESVSNRENLRSRTI